jgi:hypothetical protein
MKEAEHFVTFTAQTQHSTVTQEKCTQQLVTETSSVKGCLAPCSYTKTEVWIISDLCRVHTTTTDMGVFLVNHIHSSMNNLMQHSLQALPIIQAFMHVLLE